MDSEWGWDHVGVEAEVERGRLPVPLSQLHPRRRRLPPAITERPNQPTSLIRFYMKREINQNLSGNEVSHTACSLLVILKIFCSKIRRHRGFDIILFSYRIHVDREANPPLYNLKSPLP